jgi:hypothetical protein
MGFNNAPITRTADAESYTAKINVSANVAHADIQYKAGFKQGPPSITSRDLDTLTNALAKLDNTVKFYARAEGAGTLSAKDAAMLAQLRDDKNTSDAVYRTACKSFGVKPEPRTVNTVAAASTANLPQGAPSLRASAEAWAAFEQAHGELFQPPYGLLNLRAIEQYFADEKVQWTADTLATCYKELKAANCFRDARTLTRGMHGALTIVQPYSHDRIVALRQKQAAAIATAAPSNLSDVDREAWNAVHAKYPQLPVNSAEFKQCCSQTVQLWAKEYALEQQPELAAANKRGELRKAVDAVILQWMKNPNLGQGNKTIKDTRIWLGAIFF